MLVVVVAVVGRWWLVVGQRFLVAWWVLVVGCRTLDHGCVLLVAHSLACLIARSLACLVGRLVGRLAGPPHASSGLSVVWQLALSGEAELRHRDWGLPSYISWGSTRHEQYERTVETHGIHIEWSLQPASPKPIF